MPLSVMSSIMDFIADNVVDTSNIVAVGCDGTVINTLQNGGFIRLMEQKLCCNIWMDAQQDHMDFQDPSINH